MSREYLSENLRLGKKVNHPKKHFILKVPDERLHFATLTMLLNRTFWLLRFLSILKLVLCDFVLWLSAQFSYDQCCNDSI